MSGLKAPGTPWQQGRGPQGGSSTKAQMVGGVSPRLAAAAITSNDVADSARELGREIEAMAKTMFEQDMVADLHRRKADYQEKMEAIVRDPENGILTLKGGDAKDVTKRFDDQASALNEELLEGLSGKYLGIAKNTLSGVRNNYKRVVAQHELTQRDNMHEAARKRQEKGMKAMVVARASSTNEAQLADAINAEIAMTMQNFKGGPEQKKTEILRLKQLAWGIALKSRIGVRPEEALDLMSRIKSGEDEYWKAENLDSELLVSMHAEARDAYISIMGQGYKDQVSQYGLEAATKAIQSDRWLSEAEKGGLIREARQIKRSQIADMEAARRLKNQRLRDAVVSHWVEGKQYTDKDFFDLGFRGKDLESVKAAQSSFFKKEPKKTDIPTLLRLMDSAEHGWTDPETGKHAPFKTEDLARPEFKEDLGNITKEDLFGKVLPAIKKAGERGPSVQTVRSNAKSVFKTRIKTVYGKDSDKLWQAEDQWNVNYDTLTKKLGREPTTEELSEMGNKMMSDVVIGSGAWTNKVGKRWEVRSSLRTKGDGIPLPIKEKMIERLRQKGFVNPTDEQLFKIYSDPANAKWLGEIANEPAETSITQMYEAAHVADSDNW